MAVAPEAMQPARLLRIRSEMQIGEKDLMRLQPLILDGLRLLDLDDHLGRGEHVLRRRENAGARLLVGRVVGEDAGARAGLHHDLMPARHELANGARHEPNAELIALDLCRNADAHFFLRWKVCFPRSKHASNREKIVGFLASESVDLSRFSAYKWQ